ncbi:hypothetical protein HID58_000309 [Brassica napus]|uniref:F-box domain-containing protein n=1 Tax=Brassica napus TaxID=3708 RepID=A0ABQ8EH73_BRANA|nr:hypothetical protein HID58_000309 [Brassica napus]
MTNNPIAPPRKKKKKTKKPPSFSSIPDDVIVNILARISKSHYRSLCLVSKNFNSLLSSPDIYFVRSLIGNTEACLYVRLWVRTPSSGHRHRWFTLGYRQGQLTLVLVRALSSSYSPDRLNSTTVAVHSEIYQIGGSNENKPTRAVRVLDCRSHTWRSAPDMKVARKHAMSYFLDEKIYVIGRCKKTKEKMSWGEVFDLKTQTWKPLPKPPSHDNYVDGAVFGGRLYVFTINNEKYAYDPTEESWVQEAGFEGLEGITGPWCIMGSLIFAEYHRMYVGYDASNGKWLMVHGLDEVHTKRTKNSRTIQLVNHGGKLVIIWDVWHMCPREHKSIWCAVISLEERLTQSEYESHNSETETLAEMTTNPIAPPLKKIKKMKKPPSFSSIPDDVIVNILARISKSHYRSLSLVSKHLNSLLSSPDIYFARSLIGNTDARLYMCLWLPTPSSSHRDRWFNLSYRLGQLTLVPVRALSSSYSPDRLSSTTVAVHSEIYQMGGSNGDKRTRAVRVLDCRSHTWRRAPDMKVYVIGGCTQREETMTWGEVFDLKTQTWKPLPKPPSDDDVNSYHNGVVFEGRLFFFTTKKNNKNYAYDPKEGRWVQEAGFVGLEGMTGPWCVIGSVIFAEHGGIFKWYDPRNGKWLEVHGLNEVHTKRAKSSRTIQLVNHGGKLVIIWDAWHMRQREHKSVWCAVISLEKCLFPSSYMRGRVEECRVFLGLAHKSYKLSSCLSSRREKVRERKADRVEGSDVRTARERACRRRSPSIFRRVIFYGFSHLSSPYRLVGALVRALAVVVTSGGDPSPVEALCLSNDASGWRMGVKLRREGVSGEDVVELLSLGGSGGLIDEDGTGVSIGAGFRR